MGPRAGLDRCGKSRLHRDSIPDRPVRNQSLYRLRYPAHTLLCGPGILLGKGKSKVIPLQAQRVGRGIALLFHGRCSRRG